MYTPSGYSTLPWYRWPIEIDDVPSYKPPFLGDFPYVSHNQMVDKPDAMTR